MSIKSKNDYNRDRFNDKLKQKDLKGSKARRHNSKQYLKDWIDHDFDLDEFDLYDDQMPM